MLLEIQEKPTKVQVYRQRNSGQNDPGHFPAQSLFHCSASGLGLGHLMSRTRIRGAEFPRSPVAKTPHSQCKGLGLIPSRDFPGGSDSKESSCNAGDPGSIPGSGRSLGEGNSYPLQYSCLENSMDRGARGLQSIGARSQT